MPKFLNFVKKIHYYCELFTSLLSIEHRALAFCEARKQRLQRAYDDMDDLREQYEDEREGQPPLGGPTAGRNGGRAAGSGNISPAVKFT